MLLRFRPRHTTEARYGSLALALVERLFIAPTNKGINRELSLWSIRRPDGGETLWGSELPLLPRARRRQRHISVHRKSRPACGRCASRLWCRRPIPARCLAGLGIGCRDAQYG